MRLTNNFLLVPNASLDINKLLHEAGRSHDEASKTISTTGISSIRYAHPKLFSGFVFDGLERIQQQHRELLANVDTVIVVSQTFDQRIPSVSSRIQNKLNLAPDTFCIDVIDGCSGYIKALSLAEMLEKKGRKKICIVAGDLNSTMTRNADVGTKILFGDGVSVSILESDHSTLETKIYNNGDLNNVISCSAYDNVMNMHGFEVFRFTRNVVPQMIRSHLNNSKETLDSYDLVAIHQASKLIVSAVCVSIKYNNQLCDDFACEKIGNLGAGSIGAWLSQASGLEKKGRLKMLAIGFGSGLSWGLASLVVEVTRNEVIYV